MGKTPPPVPRALRHTCHPPVATRGTEPRDTPGRRRPAPGATTQPPAGTAVHYTPITRTAQRGNTSGIQPCPWASHYPVTPAHLGRCCQRTHRRLPPWQQEDTAGGQGPPHTPQRSLRWSTALQQCATHTQAASPPFLRHGGRAGRAAHRARPRHHTATTRTRLRMPAATTQDGSKPQSSAVAPGRTPRRSKAAVTASCCSPLPPATAPPHGLASTPPLCGGGHSRLAECRLRSAHRPVTCTSGRDSLALVRSPPAAVSQPRACQPTAAPCFEQAQECWMQLGAQQLGPGPEQDSPQGAVAARRPAPPPHSSEMLSAQAPIG